jgi:predicted RNase H-like HicB family nuclease
MANIKEALELYLATLKERDNLIVKDDTHISEICVSL